MEPFSGVAAALESLRFTYSHLGEAIRTATPRAAITTLIVFFTYSGQPAGPGAALGDVFQIWPLQTHQLAGLLSAFVGNLVVSVGWIRYVLLAEKPSFKKFVRTGSYFVAALLVSVASIVAAIPGALVLYVGMLLLNVYLALLGGIAMLLGAAIAYLRLCTLLPAAAVGQNSVVGYDAAILDAFDITSDVAWQLAAGLVLASLFSFLPLFLIKTFIGLASMMTPPGSALMIGLEFFTQLGGLLVACVLSSFLANTYQALAHAEISAAQAPGAAGQ